jgi:hypothetical protein
LSTAASSRDILSFISDGTNLYGVAQKAFASVFNLPVMHWGAQIPSAGFTTTTIGSVLHGSAWSPSLGRFVLTGDSGHIFTSSDGYAWTQQVSGVGADLTAVCWAPELGLFVAVGSGGTVRTSPDGFTWTTRTPAGAAFLYGVTWAAGVGRLVAVGASGSIQTSPDGITWTARTSGTTNGLESVAWSPSLPRLVAVGTVPFSSSGLVLHSSDGGLSWTSISLTTTQPLTSVAWSVERATFVAVAGQSSNLNFRVVTSTDGFTWVGRSLADHYWQSVSYSPELDMFLAVGARSGLQTIAYSVDGGASWTLVSGMLSQYYTVVWSPAQYVFVCAGNAPVATGRPPGT